MQPHHDHGNHAGGAAPRTPRRALVLALALTTAFLLVEAVMGWWSGSLALLADAGHMLGDAGALALSLLVAWIAEKPRSPDKTYGFRRAEVIGALINAAVLCVVSFGIVREASERLGDPPHVRGMALLLTACGGLLVNLLAAWVLHGAASHNLNVRAALWHVVGDALGSVAAIAAGIGVVVFDTAIADPIASLLIAVVLFWGAVRLLRETTHLLMEGVPAGFDVHELQDTILNTPGVESVHDLHVWALAPGEPMLTAHVVLGPGGHGTDVARLVGERLRSVHGLAHVTIQPEAPVPDLVPLRVPGAKQKLP